MTIQVIPLDVDKYQVISGIVEFKVKRETQRPFYDNGIIFRYSPILENYYIYDMVIHGSIEYLELCILIKKAIEKIKNNKIGVIHES